MLDKMRIAVPFFLVALLYGGEMNAQAAEQIEITLTPECTTKATGLDGKRHSCTSEWSTITTPEGYVFIENSLTKTYLGDAGSENRIDHEWLDYVEIVPDTGIFQPRTLRVRAYARGPKGHGTGRGWTKAEVKARYVKYR